MRKLSFREYYESKEQLLQASKSLPSIVHEYAVRKYCKLPVIAENDKTYVSLKPKEIIKILWEFQDIKNPQIKSVFIGDKKFLPSWSNDKFKKWITSMTVEK